MLAIKPNLSEALNNIGNAIAKSVESIAIKPVEYNYNNNNNDIGLLINNNHYPQYYYYYVYNIASTFYKSMSSPDNTKEGYLPAIKYYDRALAIDPNATDILTNKGIVLIKLERYDEALQIFDKILSIDANNAGALYNKGVVLNIEGKALEAKEYKDKALDINPNYSGEFFNRVSTITQVGAGTQVQQEDVFAGAL